MGRPGPSATAYAALEAFIEVIQDHQRYNAQLVPDLTDLLTSMTSSVSGPSQDSPALSSQSQTNATNTCFNKQVKRLFNQSLSTLTKWSEIVKASDFSDVVTRETPSAAMISHTNTASSTADISTSNLLTTATQTSATTANRSRSVATRKLVPENERVQGRTGLVHGAKKHTQGTAIAQQIDTRIARINRSTPTTSKAMVPSTAPHSVPKADLLTASSHLSSAAINKATKSSVIYDTKQPTYAHITALVDIGFLGVRTLELMGNNIPSSLFEIEKARSNLISKIIQLGMKKRALQELGYLREQLVLCAISLWDEPDLKTMALQTSSSSWTQHYPKESQPSSVDSIKRTYQHLFTFPFPKALFRLNESSSSKDPHLTGDNLERALTFARLVQALHNNALRCWMDVRNGSLAYLLPEMMSQAHSPYDWCICVTKLDQHAGQQSLDALFRLLFISAGKVVESNPSRASHQHAFTLRMLGLQYYGAQKHFAGANDGMIWDKVLRCGAEFEKSTRDQQDQDDILFLVNSYKATFEFLSNLSAVEPRNPRFQEWYKHFDFLARKLNDPTLQMFVQNIQHYRQDGITKAATPSPTTCLSQPGMPSSNMASEGAPYNTPATRSISVPFMNWSTESANSVSQCLEDVVTSLRKLEDILHGWHSVSYSGSTQSEVEKRTDTTLSALESLERALPSFPDKGYSSGILQNIARIFRSMDAARSIGSKIIDKIEKAQDTKDLNEAVVAGSTSAQFQYLLSVQSVTRILSDTTAGLWDKTKEDYLALWNSDRDVVPDPTKLSCARVDAILLLFRLNQSNLMDTTQPEPRSILTYLESAFALARDMDDNESLPWISNALYNYGGSLFKAGKKKEAIRPLEVAIECYQHWLGDELSTDTSLGNQDPTDVEGAKNSKARLVLANRCEVLGVCLQAVNELDRALECFNVGLCVLPLSAFRDIDAVAMGETRTSQLPAAKLLNRRIRIMLMMKQPYFKSVVTSVAEFDAKMTRSGTPLHIRGIVQEFECSVLSALSVKTTQAGFRAQEQIEIMQHLMNKVYHGGSALVNPIRRARVLVQLAMLYQGDPGEGVQQEAIHFTEEAIEILKGKHLKADTDLEHVRNHNLAMAYSWYGILDHSRSNGFSRKSKPFQIALQLWEMILSNVECFVSREDTGLFDRKAILAKVAKCLPEPELLYDHLQMLADCLGMNDYRVLQVQIYLLMLKLCNGVLTVSDDTCASMDTSSHVTYLIRAIPDNVSNQMWQSIVFVLITIDAVRIYARMGGAYLALGYSGKAKMALNQGQLILEEMAQVPGGLHKCGDVYATWLLTYSLYLTSVGHKAQGVSAYNQARYYSESHQPLIGHREGSTGALLRSITLPRKVEAKVYRALVLVEASLARSQLLFYEGNIPEAISDSKRAGRQLSRIVSTLSSAVKAAREDSEIVRQQPMENPFLETDPEPKNHQRDDRPREQLSYESRQLQHGLEMLATQRYQWLIVRLLIEAYHQLGKLYLIQGSVREAQYFLKEGKHIAQLCKAGKSVNRFMLDEAELELRRHEWGESQQMLQDLAMQEDDINAGALAWELQDAKIQRLRGEVYFATKQWELSTKAFYRTEEMLSHLMDKAFISGLEQLVIREPQTPREAKLVTVNYRQGVGWKNIRQETSDKAQYECVMLGGLKAELGYRISLILAQRSLRVDAYGLIDRSKAEDPMGFTIAKYHHSRAKILILELEEAMSRDLMFAMVLDSALSVGLFKRIHTQQLRPPSLFNQTSIMDELGMSVPIHPDPESIFSSPSVRATRSTRRRRLQLSSELALQSSLGSRQGNAFMVDSQPKKDDSTVYYRKLVLEAREHLSAAYRYSIHSHPPHEVSDICFKQAFLCVLESCLHQETTLRSSNNSLWGMANRAACYLEMAKAITQHREMHGLIKQKLNPESVQEDNAWPRDIQPKDHAPSDRHHSHQIPLETGECYATRHGSKVVNLIGLEKPRRLNLFEQADDEPAEKELEMDEDLKEIGVDYEDLKTRHGRQEYYNQKSRLHSSTSLGNERSFLETMDAIYERDYKMIMNDQPEVFQREFVDILPDKWTVISLSLDVDREVLYVNRLRAKSIPLVVRLPLDRAQSREGENQDFGLQHALELGFDMQLEKEPGPPLSYKKALEELEDILRESQKTLSLTSSKEYASTGSSTLATTPSDLPREIKAEWWNQRQRLDDRLCTLLETMEDQWLCGLRGLIQSHNTPADDENLLEFKRRLEWIVSQALISVSTASYPVINQATQRIGPSNTGSPLQLEINIDLCRVILHLGDQPSYTVLKDLIYFLLDAFLYKDADSSAPPSMSGPVPTIPALVGYSGIQFGSIALQIKEALKNYWQAETKAKNNGFDDGAHVILILDKHLQSFPWESCPVLREEAVSRVPSMWFLRDRILQQQYFSSPSTLQETFGTVDSSRNTPFQAKSSAMRTQAKSAWRDLEVDPHKTFYVLNPAGDLKNTEEEFKEYVESQEGWDGVIGRAPMDMECIDGLSKNDLYIYFGHSGGEQYIKSTQIRQLGRCAVSILLGCSSGSLKSEGDFDPTGNAMNYLLAGCPTLVANLWDVTDKDLDRFSMAMFNLWGLEDNRSDPHLQKSRLGHTDMSRTGRKLRLSLVEAVKEAREECRMKYLVGAASVVYGIPCYLK